MGTDIHLHSEIKVDGKWLHYSKAPMDRNYDLFTILGCVRKQNDRAAIVEQRGLPEDISEITRIDMERQAGDAHSFSFLSAAEIARAEEWVDDNLSWTTGGKLWGYLFGNSWGSFIHFRDEVPAAVEDIRFVFWFDC